MQGCLILSKLFLNFFSFFLLFANNQTQGRVVGSEGKEPVKHEGEFVSETGNRYQVNEQPNQPGKKAFEKPFW